MSNVAVNIKTPPRYGFFGTHGLQYLSAYLHASSLYYGSQRIVFSYQIEVPRVCLREKRAHQFSSLSHPHRPSQRFSPVLTGAVSSSILHTSYYLPPLRPPLHPWLLRSGSGSTRLCYVPCQGGSQTRLSLTLLFCMKYSDLFLEYLVSILRTDERKNRVTHDNGGVSGSEKGRTENKEKPRKNIIRRKSNRVMF